MGYAAVAAHANLELAMEASTPETRVAKLGDLSLHDFLARLSAREPAPGGGAAAALAGATGAALGAMCAAYTSGEKFQAVEAQVRALEARFTELRDRVMALLERDAQAYAAWAAARQLPKASEPEKKARRAALEQAKEASTAVPEALLAAAEDGLNALAELGPLCNPSLLADVPVAAQLFEAAARGACTQVLGNLGQPQPNSPEAARGAAAFERLARCIAVRGDVEAAVMKSWGWADDTGS